MTKESTYAVGEIIEIVFVIDSRPAKVSCTFTGKNYSVGGIKFGLFKRTDVDTGKTYLLSKAMISQMTQVSLPDSKVF